MRRWCKQTLYGKLHELANTCENLVVAFPFYIDERYQESALRNGGSALGDRRDEQVSRKGHYEYNYAALILKRFTFYKPQCVLLQENTREKSRL